MGGKVPKVGNSVGNWAVRAVVGLLTLLSGAQAADLIDVRFGPSPEATRVVFDLRGGVEYSVSGDETGAGRLLIDFTELNTGPTDRVFKPGKGHILRYGFTDSSSSGVRAVLEFKKTAKIKKVFMLEPSGGVAKHRLVVDLETAPSKQEFLASLPQRYPDLAAVIEQATAEPAVQPSVTRQAAAPQAAEPQSATPPTPTRKEVIAPPAAKTAALTVIVIDPGHGGVDPGAQGQSGTYEKTVNLAAAKQLKEILMKRGGYKVFLTRDDDSTIRPDAREAFARDKDADLFISIHADALKQKQVRGAAVYTINEKGAARSADLAKSQGDEVYDLDLDEYANLSDILLEKAQDTTNTASSKFAKKLIEKMSAKTAMLNRSHRTANLRVLLAPDVPAVLLEMAFISNAKDEANLNSKVWRKRSMTAVADAIDAYFGDQRLQRQAANRAGGAQ